MKEPANLVLLAAGGSESIRDVYRFTGVIQANGMLHRR